MRRATLAPALVAVALLAGCGQTNEALIPQDRAQAVLDAVDQVQSACDDHDSQAAQQAVADLSAQVNELPRTVDAKLKRNARQWVVQIQRRVDRDCKAEETPTPTPTPTETGRSDRLRRRGSDGRERSPPPSRRSANRLPLTSGS
jgi:hypothetical protein